MEMDRTADIVYDVWNRLPYTERLAYASRFQLKRSGVIAVINMGVGRSQIQNDGFTREDLAIFTKDFMEAIVGKHDVLELLVNKVFNYAQNEQTAEATPGQATGGEASASQRSEGEGAGDLRASEGHATSQVGTGSQDLGGDNNLLQKQEGERLHNGDIGSGLRQPHQISKEERMLNAKTPDTKLSHSEAMKLAWARRKAKAITQNQ